MIGVLIVVIISSIAGFMLGLGVDKMKEKHPEYKGGDFLDWDDNKVNSEGTF